MRIGEALVIEGLITNDQLAKALERQIIFGGRLGTNLVEMGLINEEVLARFLAKVLRVPYAEPEFFEAVDQDVLDSISKELVQRYTAFPIKKDRNRLHLAMKDPNDMAVVDELRFIVGLDIRPYIASEMRIVFALEKYYGIKRDIRYVAVQGAEKTYDNPTGASEGFVTPSKPVPKATAPVLEEKEYLGDESQMDYYTEGIFGKPAEEAPAQPQAPSPAPAPPQPPPVQAAPPPVQAAPPPVQAAPPPPPVFTAPAPQPVQPPPPVQAAPAKPARTPMEVLAAPDDREQIAGAVLEAALGQVGRAALFLVKGSVLTGWRAGGLNLSDATVTKVSITLTEPTMFKDVVEDKKFYKGPILQIPQNNQLIAALGGFYPQDAVACPLIIKGKVVAVLYGDNGQGSFVTGNVDRLAGLMSKASMSLEILILKTKILAD